MLTFWTFVGDLLAWLTGPLSWFAEHGDNLDNRLTPFHAVLEDVLDDVSELL
jgi:hypothetical protein